MLRHAPPLLFKANGLPVTMCATSRLLCRWAVGDADDEIAGYFDVEPVKVSRLLAYYELAEN